MADEVTTTTPPADAPATAPTSDDGYETITIRVPKDRPDEVLFQLHLRELQSVAGDSQSVVVGNYADVQRAGAAVVNGGNPKDGFLAPPAVLDPDTGVAQTFNPQSLEDVIAPGPAGMTADLAEVATGDRVAQGDRPDPVS